MNGFARIRPLLVLVALAAGTAGCKSKLDADLAADATDAYRSVKVSIGGIELQRDDDTTETLDRSDVGTPDLTQFDNGISFALITNASLKKDTFTGVKILFKDTDSSVIPEPEDGGTVTTDPQQLDTPEDDQEFTPVKLKIKSNKNTAILIAMDLRLSVIHKIDDTYQLQPILRAVQSGDEAEIRGNVANSFIDGSNCDVGKAVYVFPGKDVNPEGGSVQPIATAPISGGHYTVPFLPAGDYTVAVTCDGETQNGPAINGQQFDSETHNTTLDDGDIDDVDF